MYTDKTKDPKTWLFWTGLLLASLILTVALFSSVQSSQALSPLTVEVRDANIKVFIDGELVLDWTDPLLPYLSGTIGFKTHETKDGIFDDVIVTPLP